MMIIQNFIKHLLIQIFKFIIGIQMEYVEIISRRLIINKLKNNCVLCYHAHQL